MSIACGNCGNPRSEDDLFCGNCGARASAVPVASPPGEALRNSTERETIQVPYGAASPAVSPPEPGPSPGYGPPAYGGSSYDGEQANGAGPSYQGPGPVASPPPPPSAPSWTSAPAGPPPPEPPAMPAGPGSRPAGSPLPASSGGYPHGASASVALGEVTPNEAYLGARLSYEQVPEGSFDPLSSNRYMFYMARQAGFWAAVYAVLWSIFTPICWYLAYRSIASAISTANAGGGGTPSFSGVEEWLGIWVVGGQLAYWLFVILFLVIPIPVILSEWKFLVDDKGAARPTVFEHVAYAFRRRNTPVDSLGVRRLSLPGGITRDYLEVKRGDFAGYISCFEEGSDLYVGWTFWLRMRPIKWILLRLERLWHEVTQKANELYVTLRYESAKSLREALHNAAREGIDVAAGRVQPEGQGFLQSLPVSSSEVGK